MKYKNEIIITIGISFIVLFFRLMNILQIENGLGTWWAMLALIAILSYLIVQLQHHVDQHEINYSNLDFLKYVCAIVILILHLRPFQAYCHPLDFTFNNSISRICVPIFFFVTGYFVSKKDDAYILNYVKKNGKVYLLWSLMYLPLALQLFIEYWNMNLNPSLIILALPIVLVILLFYTGVYYHLWYFPALLLSL